jgi:hypothetical protein
MCWLRPGIEVESPQRGTSEDLQRIARPRFFIGGPHKVPLPKSQALIYSVYLSQLLNWQNSCLFAPYLTDKNGKYPSP